MMDTLESVTIDNGLFIGYAALGNYLMTLPTRSPLTAVWVNIVKHSEVELE